MTKKHIAHFALVVDDYDKAIDYYTNTLKFILKENTILSEEKRWVLIAPSIEAETCLLLAKASNDEQISRIGNQTGGRVFLFLYTDNFERDYQNLLSNKVKIVRNPVIEKWGTVLVFEDTYGNLWDLIQPAHH
jgi:catechol 2,3-dioxygenase-like lactoylglutathione lyase family enzyme